jgi:hypothetical protein
MLFMPGQQARVPMKSFAESSSPFLCNQISEVIKKAAIFAPSWIAANWSFNASLCMACGRWVNKGGKERNF